ncbi:MAG: hypothetical protein QXO95_01980 [Candidatus Aenigmatarchaeota archaeon]
MILIIAAVFSVYLYVLFLYSSQQKACNEFLSGNKQSVLGSLKNCIENCWSKHDFGKDIYNDDCYIVRINSSERIEKTEMENFPSVKVRAYFNSLEKYYSYVIKIRYNYTGQEISLVVFE